MFFFNWNIIKSRIFAVTYSQKLFTFRTAEIFLCLNKVSFLVASWSCFLCSLSNWLVTTARAWLRLLFGLYCWCKLVLLIEDIEFMELTLDLVLQGGIQKLLWLKMCETEKYLGRYDIWKVKLIFFFLINLLWVWCCMYIFCKSLEFDKVQIFWDGHKNLAHLPLFFWHYLVSSNYKWKMG